MSRSHGFLRRSAALLAASAALGIVAVPAVADVIVEEQSQLGGSLGSFVKMTLDTKTAISGDKARIDTKTVCGNTLMKMFCPGDSAQIIRLDRETTYQLDLKKKTYYEESFEDFRKRQQAAAEQMKKAQRQQPQETAAPDADQCEWLPPKSNLARTGEKAQFAGFDAERATITVTQPCKDRKSGSVCEIRWVADEWLTTAEIGGAERQQFWQAYAKRLMQNDAMNRAAVAQAMAYMEKYPTVFWELAKQMATLRGQPVKMTMQLSSGGPDCKLVHDAASQGTGRDAEKPSAGATVGGALGGALGDALGGLMGKLKKKGAAEASKPETAPAAPAAPVEPTPAGYVTLFEMTTETKGVSTGSSPADQFDVPAGFTKVAPPGPPAGA